MARFLLKVLGDYNEAAEVRTYILKRLRRGNGLLVPTDRPAVAKAIGEVLAQPSSLDFKVQAALALGAFTEIEGVLTQLSRICLAEEESIDLRYAAFTSIERAGPTPGCISVLRQISFDEALGTSARSVLSAWHVA